MNRKLAIRNVMRLAKDYVVYFLTMTFVTALMFAFNSILFSEDVQGLFDIGRIDGGNGRGLLHSLSCGSLRGSFIIWFALFWKKEVVNSESIF